MTQYNIDICKFIFPLRKIVLSIIFLMFGFAILAQSQVENFGDKTKKKEKKPSLFKDPEDGALDISLFLDDPAGFMAFPIIITEPAIGYGGGLGFIFIKEKKNNRGDKQIPMISGVLGAYTANHSWIAGAFHFNNWKGDKIRYLGVVAKPYINIKYYGNNIEYLSKNPIEYNMNAWLVIQRLQFRIKESNFFIGGQYSFYITKNSLDTLPDKPLINKILKKLNTTSTISMLTLITNYDSRNNIFSPTKGMNTGIQVSYNAPFLGGSNDFWRANVYYMGFFPISKRVFSGWRFDYQLGFGDIPFYAQPFISLRGAPAMRYQSKNTMLIETEWLFNVHKRWYINAFAGAGDAFNDFSEFGNSTHVFNYGFGIRYKLAKKYGILSGIDFAWTSNKEFAFYLVFGSSWRN